MKVSIVIPNFNGEALLQKNLPNILAAGAREVLIIDDASIDKSVEIIKENFPEVKLLIHQKNIGFIPTVNELFNEAIGDIVVLLNNDVWVEKGFIKPLLSHFADQQAFAVNLHEEGEGPSIAFWNNGFFEFKRGEEKNFVQKSAWASGGSAAFSKSKWKELGGFDENFSPFYWEDIDLSFRAIKAGFEILWEPDSKVKHEHETTIKKTFSKRYINWIQQRNQLLFVWKNIHDPKLLTEHKKNLVKKLLTSGLGYWIVWVWAVIRLPRRFTPRNDERNDLEAINYAQSPTISVVIVSYNSEDFIEKCITSILKHLPNSEVLVLDNNSSDSTYKKLEQFGNKIKLVKSSENLGFGRGNNKAVKQASGGYLFLLNPDTEMISSINELVNFYNDHDAGIVAPKLVTPTGQIQESVKKLPSLWGAFKEYVLGVKNAYSQYAPSVKEPIEVEMAYGAAWLIKKELFNQLNGFNEKFFLYYEDAEFCKRLNKMGKKVYYYPGVSIKHIVGGTKSDTDKYKLNLDSAKKYHGFFGALVLRTIFLISRLLKKL